MVGARCEERSEVSRFIAGIHKSMVDRNIQQREKTWPGGGPAKVSSAGSDGQWAGATINEFVLINRRKNTCVKIADEYCRMLHMGQFVCHKT